MNQNTTSVYSNIRVERRQVFSQAEASLPFCVRATHYRLGPIQLPYSAWHEATAKAAELAKYQHAQV